jgi:glutathionylspermidine synthase
MKRREITPRNNWRQKVEEVGLLYHSLDGQPYWNESACYEFTMAEVLEIERTTQRLHEMCLQVAQYVIDNKMFARLAIPESMIDYICETWEAEPPALYGRMDLAYDGDRLVLLEYNADTPTALVEAAIAQWYWLQDVYPKSDQFNSLHERLVAKWVDLQGYVDQPVYFAHLDSLEDTMTINYLRDTAQQAGLKTHGILMESIGWNGEQFVDEACLQMGSTFKLYPWENLCRDKFGAYAMAMRNWIEPAWKILLSNKAILAVLWEMYPNDANLLEATDSQFHRMDHYVKKPIFGREGANVTIFEYGVTSEATDGLYGESGWVYQKLAKLRSFDGRYPILGSWMIDQDPAGMGIRESTRRITGNTSCFVPHRIVD